MKKFILLCFVMLTMTSLQANAFDWGSFFRGIFSIPAPVSEIEKSSAQELETYKNEVESSLTDIANKEALLDNPTQETFLAIVSMISPANDTQTIKSKLQSIKADNSLTYQEKCDAVNDVMTEYRTKLTNSSLATVVTMKAFSEANKTKLSNNIKMLADNGQKYVELGRDSIKTLDNFNSQVKKDDDTAETVNEINNVTGRLSNKATATVYLANQLKTMAKIAGIKL